MAPSIQSEHMVVPERGAEVGIHIPSLADPLHRNDLRKVTMYTGMLPKTGAGLTVAGIAMSTLNLVWVGIAAMVIGGTIVTLSKFGPRIAFEPMPVGVRGSRFRLTYNGRPMRLRSK